jgi:2'-5' RNA ligase
VRLFVAVSIPAAIRAEVAAWVPRAEALTGDTVRWNAPDQWHLTLVFLGEVPEDRLPAVVAAGTRTLHEAAAARLQLRGGGRFGDRVLWVGLRDDGALRGLADALRAELRTDGFPVDDKPFRPHLTLARSRSGRRPDLRPAAAALDGFVGSSWTADAVHLMHSRLGAGPDGRAAHEVVHTWPLQ